MSPAADLDGDGQDDLVVGAPACSFVHAAPPSGAVTGGAVYVVRGPVRGHTSLAAADATIYDHYAYEAYLGGRADASADLTGDGWNDVLVAEKWLGTGEVHVIPGPVDGPMTILDVTAWMLTVGGEPSVGALGQGLRVVGDLDGDGNPDVAVGAKDYADWPDGCLGGGGLVYFFRSPLEGMVDLKSAGVRVRGCQAGGGIGYEVEAQPDPGGGAPAVLLGTGLWDVEGSLDAGAVFSVAASVGPEQVVVDNSLGAAYGNAPDLLFGARVEGGFDVDKDGQNDILVGGSGLDDAGGYRPTAYLLRGPLSEMKSVTESTFARFIDDDGGAGFPAMYVLLPGDLDGDGHQDVVVSSPFRDDYRGAVYFFYGPIEPRDYFVREADAAWLGELPGGEAGWAIERVGDLSGDGLPDIGIGEPFYTPSGKEAHDLEEAGRVYVVYGVVD